MISLFVQLLLSVVAVDVVAAHPSAFRHKQHNGVTQAQAQAQAQQVQRKLQEKELGEMLCPSSPDINGSCDVSTQEGQKCDYQKMYSGCGTTEEEELECIPTVTCTCNALGDETWGCVADAMMDTCPDGTAGSEMRGIDCTPSSSPTSDSDSDGTSSPSPSGSDRDGTSSSAAGSADSASSATGSSNSDVNNDDGGIDLLDAINNSAGDNSAVVVDETTTAVKDDAVDNGTDLGEVATAAPVAAPGVVDDNDPSTIITVEDEGESVTVTTVTTASDPMSSSSSSSSSSASTSSSTSSSSSSSQKGLVVANVAIMAVATTTAAVAITIFL